MPAHAVEQVVEYESSPLPLAASGVAGIAVLGGDVVVSLRPLGDLDAEDASRRKTTGILLVSSVAPTCEGVRYAVEITRVVALVEVRPGRRIAGETWIREGITIDGRTLPMLDIEAMVGELGLTGLQEGGTN